MKKKIFFKTRQNRKIRFGNPISLKTICLVIIITLGLFGASYARWSQSFGIFGIISTGNINVFVTDATVESTDSYEFFSFNINKDGNVVDSVNLNVITTNVPFGTVISFKVENMGTIPVRFVGMDLNIPDASKLQVIEAPGRIDVGESAYVRVRVLEGYCSEDNFSAFFKFEQTG